MASEPIAGGDRFSALYRALTKERIDAAVYSHHAGGSTDECR